MGFREAHAACSGRVVASSSSATASLPALTLLSPKSPSQLRLKPYFVRFQTKVNSEALVGSGAVGQRVRSAVGQRARHTAEKTRCIVLYCCLGLYCCLASFSPTLLLLLYRALPCWPTPSPSLSRFASHILSLSSPTTSSGRSFSHCSPSITPSTLKVTDTHALSLSFSLPWTGVETKCDCITNIFSTYGHAPELSLYSFPVTNTAAPFRSALTACIILLCFSRPFPESRDRVVAVQDKQSLGIEIEDASGSVSHLGFRVRNGRLVL